MTDIPYLVQIGNFLPDCRSMIHQNHQQIIAGAKIRWTPNWPGGGWGNHYLASIVAGDHYPTTFSNPDWHNAPARLRALATALRDEGMMFFFHLDYKDGTVTLQRRDLPGDCNHPASVLIDATGGTDEWWRELQSVLEDALARHLPWAHNLIFRGGGHEVIPPWFHDWCHQNGIHIAVSIPADFDARLNQEIIEVEDVPPAE